MRPLHLSKSKFAFSINWTIFFTIIDPVDDLSIVDGHGDMVFFFDKLKLVNRGRLCWNTSFTKLNGNKTFVFSQVCKGTIWFFGVIGVIGNMIIV